MKRTLFFSIVILVSCLMFGSRVCEGETLDQSFDAANRLYDQGKFSEASSAYEKMISEGHHSVALLYNAGNAWFKQGQLGRAIADYRKAQMLSVRDPDVRRNLQIARTRARGGSAYQAPIWQRITSVLSLNLWTILTAVSIWAIFILMAAGFWRPSLRPQMRSPIYLFLGFTLLFGIGFLIKYTEETKSIAIVIAGETDVRNGPLEESPAVFKVRDGAELEIVDRKDDWVQVVDGSERIGWLRKDQLAVSGLQAG